MLKNRIARQLLRFASGIIVVKFNNGIRTSIDGHDLNLKYDNGVFSVDLDIRNIVNRAVSFALGKYHLNEEQKEKILSQINVDNYHIVDKAEPYFPGAATIENEYIAVHISYPYDADENTIREEWDARVSVNIPVIEDGYIQKLLRES